jgi:hypothetical protein
MMNSDQKQTDFLTVDSLYGKLKPSPQNLGRGFSNASFDSCAAFPFILSLYQKTGSQAVNT